MLYYTIIFPSLLRLLMKRRSGVAITTARGAYGADTHGVAQSQTGALGRGGLGQGRGALGSFQHQRALTFFQASADCDPATEQSSGSLRAAPEAREALTSRRRGGGGTRS